MNRVPPSRHFRRILLAGLLPLLPAGQLPAQDDSLTIRIENGVPIVETDGSGILEVAASPEGPWRPLREAVPGATLETPVPPDAQTRFVRLRRPDGRMTDVESILPGLPMKPPAFEKVTLSRYNGRVAQVEAVLPKTEAGKFPLILPYVPGDSLVLLRDDGRDGDAVAADGVYTGAVPVDLRALERAHDFALLLPASSRTVPFRSRQPLFDEGVPLSESAKRLDDLISGRPVVLPIPLGVSPSAGPVILPGAGAGGPGGVTPCGDLPTWQKTLLITDLSVVEDPERTFDPVTGAGTPMGAWTFGRLMTDMANTPVSGITPSDFVRRWLRSWEVDQVINHDPVPNRAAGMASIILDAWHRASGGRDKPLDMARAPFRLLAIVNRIDLRGNLSYGGGFGENGIDSPSGGGEARFVFAFADAKTDRQNGYPGPDGGAVPEPPNGGRGREFLVILEYGTPKHTCGELHAFAREWAALQCIPFGPEYNRALQAITDQFAAAGADPRRPNGSAINQVRTNENLLDPLWEMREFRIFSSDADAGHLRPVTVKQTPRESVNGTALLADYITTTVPAPPDHFVPRDWSIAGGPMEPFAGGRAIMAPAGTAGASSPWGASGVTVANPLRHVFALNTCSGCHFQETDMPFLHIGGRGPGHTASISGFLKGDGAGGPWITTVPGSPTLTVSFFDLMRREQDLIHFILTPCSLAMFDRPLEDGAVH